MPDLQTTPFQRILSEGQSPTEAASGARRAQIERFIGNYIVTWAHVDLFLGMAVSAWAGTSQKNALTHTTSRKVQLLQSHLPPEWADGARLVGHLEEANHFRNALAHFGLAVSGSADGEHLGWHLWDVKGRKPRLNLTDTEMAARRAAAQVLSDAVTASMQYRVLHASRLYDVSLHDLIVATPRTWEDRAEFFEYRRRADEMFGL